MFVYYYRLRDKYDLPIASLAILGDERETWRPVPFQRSHWTHDRTTPTPTID
jgi:hypothetical protein